jgi:hypothetical protein
MRPTGSVSPMSEMLGRFGVEASPRMATEIASNLQRTGGSLGAVAHAESPRLGEVAGPSLDERLEPERDVPGSRALRGR